MRNRLKINEIISSDEPTKELGKHAVASLAAAGIDSLLVALINNNVQSEVLRIIGIALFGIGAVESGVRALTFGVMTGIGAIANIKEKRSLSK